jgi:hypothetical protein
MLLKLIESRIALNEMSQLPSFFSFEELLKNVTANRVMFKKCLKLCQNQLPPYLVDLLNQGLIGLTAYC